MSEEKLSNDTGYLYIISIPSRIVDNVYKFGRTGAEKGILGGRKRDNPDLEVYWSKKVSNYIEHETNILCIFKKHRIYHATTKHKRKVLSEWIRGIPLNVLISTITSYLEMYDMTNGLTSSLMCFGMAASSKTDTKHITSGIERWDTYIKQQTTASSTIIEGEIEVEGEVEIKENDLPPSPPQSNNEITVKQQLVNMGSAAVEYTMLNLSSMFKKLKLT